MGSSCLAVAPLLTPSLLAEAEFLSLALARAVERSRDLVWLGHRRRTAAVEPPGIAGGSDDAGLVALLIVGAWICADCIAAKTGIPRPDVESLVDEVGRTLTIRTQTAHCNACLNEHQVFRVA